MIQPAGLANWHYWLLASPKFPALHFLGFEIQHNLFSKGLPTSPVGRSGEIGLGVPTLQLSLVSNMVSNRFIRRDEQLVRSADRMR
jgi:hypothetical protein